MNFPMDSLGEPSAFRHWPLPGRDSVKKGREFRHRLEIAEVMLHDQPRFGVCDDFLNAIDRSQSVGSIVAELPR